MNRADIRILTEQDATSFRSLRLHGLQEAPEAFSVTYDEYILEPLSTIVEQVRPKDQFSRTLRARCFSAGRSTGWSGRFHA